MSEDIWYKYYLKEFCFDDSADPLLKAKPAPMLWSYYFIASMKLDKQRGFDFSKKCVTIIYQLLEESLTTLQDLVLKGDVATTEYQIQRQAAQAPKDGEEHKPIHQQDKSVLHYAVLSGNVPMVQMLLGAGYLPELNAPDLITAFTPLHMAVFIENRDMMWTLISHGAKPDLLDSYRGTALDYARITQLMPYKYQKQRDSTQIKVYDDKAGKIQAWSVQQFEEKFNVTWCADWIATNEYIEELLFGGFTLGNPDMEFREQYMPVINASSGDENIVIAEISPQVGWGAFAARDIKKGEFIVKYGGQVMVKKGVKDRSYSMQSGLEGFILNSKQCRNTGAFLNHSSTPNAQAECVFEKGVEQAVILAIEDIPRGKQLFIDYSERYFSKGVDMNEFLDMNTAQNEFPTCLPSTAFS